MGFAGWYSSDLTMEHPNIICQATVQSFVINKGQKNRVDKSENWLLPHRGVSHWYGEIKGPGCCVYSPAAINAQISSSLLCFLVFFRASIAGSPSSCIFCRFPVGILDFFCLWDAFACQQTCDCARARLPDLVRVFFGAASLRASVPH